jgi:hypothetical protein
MVVKKLGVGRLGHEQRKRLPRVHFLRGKRLPGLSTLVGRDRCLRETLSLGHLAGSSIFPLVCSDLTVHCFPSKHSLAFLRLW